MKHMQRMKMISIIIKTGSKNNSVLEVALKLLETIKNIDKLKDIGINSLMKIDGIGMVKAIELKAALELGRRVYSNNNVIDKINLNNSNSIYEYFLNEFRDKKHRKFRFR